MLTAGEILRQKREEKGLTLDEVKQTIKVKKKFLAALEEDRLEKLPSETYARGFIKNYADFLGVPWEKVLAVFRRQLKREEEKPLLLERAGKDSFFKITPQRIKGALVLILFFLFFGYLFRQYQFLTQGPTLNVFEPLQNIFTHQRKTVIRGKTDPEAQVFINSQEIFPNEKGEFFQEISLSEGINEVVILAEDQRGKRKTVVREVTFEPL